MMAKTTTPDLTSVTTLTKTPTKLARTLKLTPAAIYRWRKVNRIPDRKSVV